MPDNPQRNPLDELADSFMIRFRNGERPALSEYTDRYPELADDIREVFPALVMMHQVEDDLRHVEQEPHAETAHLQQLGDFRIIREVGRGGMGIVYEAEQVSLGRRVALKVLPKQALLDSKHKQRFLREAKAAARLHHTNIVPVFGVGEQEGLHYYVMQFIHGLGLDEVLVELQRLREESVEGRVLRVEGREVGAGRNVSAVAVANSLMSGRFERTFLVDSDEENEEPSTHSTLDTQHSTSQHANTVVGQLSDTLPGHGAQTSSAHSRTVYWHSVARIGLQAAQALQYAHDQGIIHRDIKPGNLLLDTRGSVWVTDFGLAKAADQQDLTNTGDVLGTLRYMAPEQFDGQADARSDVFSLGLTLYELLALKPAFNERDRHKLIKQVTSGAPPRLRTLDPNIPRDLETIVHKAIDREPSHRYQTADELAADLQRYLENEPIRARWISPVTRFMQWCKRNPAVAGLTSTITVLLLAAAVVSSIAAAKFENLAVQANQDKEAAEDARIQAEGAQIEAEEAADREKELRQIAESERDRANTNFNRARRAVNTYLDDVTETELLSVPGLQPLREELLSAALTFYSEFTAEETDDPELLIEIADAQYRLGRIHWELDDKEASIAANAEAVRLFEQLDEQHPNDVDIQAGLAHALYFARRYDDTVHLCKTILDTHPEHADIRARLAETYNSLAIDEKNDIATALAYHQQAFELREALAREYPDNARYLAQLGATLNNLGVLLGKQQKNDEALAMYQRAVSYSARAYELLPHSVVAGDWLCNGVRNCALKQKLAGATEQARQSFARLVALRRDLALRNPAVTRLQAGLYRACLERSRYEQQLGNSAEAERAIREGRRVLELLPHDSAEQLAELSFMYASLSRLEEGEPDESIFDADERAEFADQAIATLAEAIRAGYRNLKSLRQESLLDPLREREDFRELLEAVQRIRQAEQLAGVDSGTEEEQLASRREGLEILRDLQDTLDVDVALADTLHSMGVLQTGLKEFDEAERLLREALRVREAAVKKDPADVEASIGAVSTRVALGDLHWSRGEFPAAHQLWQQCLRESDAIATTHPDSSAVRNGRLAAEEELIFGRYGRLLLWPLLSQYGERAIRNERAFQYGTTGYSDGQLTQGVLAANNPDLTQRLLTRFTASFQNAPEASGFTLLAQSSLVRSAAIADLDILPADQMLQISQRCFDQFSDRFFVAVSLALAQYHAGRYDDALETVRPHRQQTLAFVEAAITERLGDHASAVALWDGAEARYRTLCADILSIESPDEDFLRLSGWHKHWWHFATIQALRREAAGVIHGHEPDDAWQHLIQARGYRLIGEHDEAEAQLAAAVSSTSGDPDVWMARAELLGRWGELERAEADWQRVVDLAGDDAMPRIHRGRWYAERGEHEKAEADFARAAELTPDELNKFLEAGWWVVGPYPENLDEFCPPEIDPDPSRPVHVIDPQTGLSERPVAWQFAPTGRLGEVRMKDVLGSSDGSGYALAYVYSAQECTRLLRIGSASGIRIWCNAELVFRTDETLTDNEIWASRVPITLRPGQNVILLRAGLDTPLTLRVADTPADQVLAYAEQGLWSEAADVVFVDEPSVFGDLFDDEGYFASIRMALFHGDNQILQREGERLLQMALDDAKRWNQIRAAAALLTVENPLVREHAVELMAVLAEQLPETSSNRSQEQLCLLALVACATLTGDTDTARAYLIQLEGESEKVSSHLGPDWAIVEEQAGRHDQAVAALESGLQLAVRSPTYWPWFVRFLGRLREAERLVTGSTARVDEMLDNQRQTALADWNARDPATSAYDHLVATWARVVGEHERPAYPWLARGRRLGELGRFDEAEADFNKAVELAPDDAEIVIARAVFFADRGDVDRAATSFCDALAMSGVGEWGDYWKGLPVYFEVARRPDVLDRLESLRPQDAFARRMRMTLHVQQGELGAARADAQRLEQNEWQRGAGAPVALLQGDIQSFADMRATRHTLPPLGQAELLKMAPVDSSLGEELLTITLDNWSDPANRWHQRWLGEAQFRAGRWEDAVTTLESSLNPAFDWQCDGCYWPVLAMAHHRLGNADAAHRYLEMTTVLLELYQQMSTAQFCETVSCRGANPATWLQTVVYHREAQLLIDGEVSTAQDDRAGLPSQSGPQGDEAERRDQ